MDGDPRSRLLATERRGPVILTNSLGLAWAADGFSSSWAKLWIAPALTASRFTTSRHSRRAACDRRRDGATDRDGHRHSLKDVEAILDAHYLGRDIQLAEAAVLKLEARTKL